MKNVLTSAAIIRARDSLATLAEQRAAFDEIVTLYQEVAYGWAYAVLGDFHLAQDAAQESFVSAWNKLAQLQHPSAFAGWFRGIVLTECNRLTRRKRLKTTSLDDFVQIPSTLADAQKALEENELRQALWAAIEELPENERAVVWLFYTKECTLADISRILGLPTTTVAKRLYSARMRLKRKMTSFRHDTAGDPRRNDGGFAEKVREGTYDGFVGRYQFELRPDLVVLVTREGDRLMSEAAGQKNELFAQGECGNELLIREFAGGGRFVRDKAGRVTHLVYYEFGREMGFARKIG